MAGDLISRDTLEEFAGSTVFRCGEEHFSCGAVSRLRVVDDKISVRVEGTHKAKGANLEAAPGTR